MDFDLTLLIIIGAAALLVIIFIAAGYIKASPDIAKIISGLSKKPRVFSGRAGFRIPFFEREDEIYLGQISVDIKTDTFIPTNDFINVKVDAIAKIRVKNDAEGIQLAIRNFLNVSPENIAAQLQDSLQGNMREIIGTLDLKTINTDRDQFSDQVMAKAAKDMEKLGIEVISCNIQNVIDEHGLINDMGMDNTAKIKKEASIAKANADKEVAIAQAEADQAANTARVKADTEIAMKQNELEIKKAELKRESDTAKAIADAAYEIQKQEQEKTIQTAAVQVEIAKANQEAELKEKLIAIREKELQAECNKVADAEKYTAEKKADAEKYTAEKNADAKKYSAEQDAEANFIMNQREAEAKLIMSQKEAEGIKAKYEAEAAGIKAKSAAEAAGIKAKGEAEAATIKAKGEAEAEAMSKKADAYQKYNKAAVVEMMINIMPQMAAEIAKPLAQIKGINIYGGNAADGMSQISGTPPAVMKQVFDTMSSATGVNFSEILKAETYDAKVNKNLNLNGKGAEINVNRPKENDEDEEE